MGTPVFLALLLMPNGQGHKAFLLPQLNPVQNILLPKSYNVPELTKDAVNTKGIKEAIYKD